MPICIKAIGMALSKQALSISKSFLKACDPSTTKIIVEDLSSVNNDGRMMCCSYSIKGYGGLLGGIADMAREMRMDVDNVEFRYCRVVSVGPLLHEASSKTGLSRASNAITMDIVLQEVFGEIEKIKKYDDGKFLNDAYKRAISSVGVMIKQLGFDRNKKQSVAEFCSVFNRGNDNEYLKNLEKVCVFDSALIDMNIMHSIAIAPEKAVIVVIAGGSHIEKMCDFLNNMGYEKINTPSSSITVPTLGIENALESREQKVKAGGSSKPPAIDLSVVEMLVRTN
jgi:hypothetical protein